MRDQKTLILDRDWDYLFILDACRYDFFKRVYGDYLSGELSPVKSAGSATSEWAVKTFGSANLDDVVYVSGNPWFNSKFPMKDFDARKHFHEIVDVWDWGWDEDGTVRPEPLIEGLKKAENKFPRKSKIIHFMQPHQPYLCLLGDDPSTLHKTIGFFFDFLEKIKSVYSGEETVSTAKNENENVSLRRRWGDWLREKIGNTTMFNLRELFGLPPATVGEAFYRNGRSKLKEYYSDNLKRALVEIKRIVGSLRGDIVVSADHGEFLGRPTGEDYDYEGSQDVLSDVKLFSALDGSERILGHPTGVKYATLRKVPWLEVEK